MTEDALFYEGYGDFKGYSTPTLKKKHIKRFDKHVWQPAAFSTDMSVLEFGCGTGMFLAYLKAKGVTSFIGLDHDVKLADHLPDGLSDHFLAADIWDYLDDEKTTNQFDRVAFFDVLEHFAIDDGLRLLRALRSVLKPKGQIIVKVPNVSSPWGAQYQYGDLTHKVAYTPASIRQLAEAAGYTCVACYGHHDGSRGREITQAVLHGFLKRMLAKSPEIWTADFFAVLAPKP